MFKLPLKNKNILTAMSLNDNTIQRLLKVGFKPFNFAGRIMYSNGEIHIVGRGTVPPVYIPKFTLHNLTNIVFEDMDVVMDMVSKLNTRDPSSVCESEFNTKTTVTITNRDRVLTFQMPDSPKHFTSAKMEMGFNEYVEMLHAMGVNYELQYRPVYIDMAVSQPACAEVPKDNRLCVAHYLAAEGSGIPDPQNFSFLAGEFTYEELSDNAMEFNIFNTRVSCVVDDEYLQPTALLVGKEPKELLGDINRRFARKIDEFIVDLCYNLDIEDTDQLPNLLNPHF